MSNSSIWTTDGTLSGATTRGQSGLGSNDNEGVLCIPQSSSITEASPSDCLVSYPKHSLFQSYSSHERCSWCILQPKPTRPQGRYKEYCLKKKEVSFLIINYECSFSIKPNKITDNVLPAELANISLKKFFFSSLTNVSLLILAAVVPKWLPISKLNKLITDKNRYT